MSGIGAPRNQTNSRSSSRAVTEVRVEYELIGDEGRRVRFFLERPHSRERRLAKDEVNAADSRTAVQIGARKATEAHAMRESRRAA